MRGAYRPLAVSYDIFRAAVLYNGRMAPITLIYSVLMIILGVGTYLATETTSKTPLIPAGFGIVFLLLGLLAFNDKLRKHVMHAASALGLVAFLAAVIVLIVRGGSASQAALGEQGVMALLSAGFVALCVRSFIEARKARKSPRTQDAA